jgi:hypothetical protein
MKLLIAAALLSAPAQPPLPQCLTRTDVNHLTLYAMPLMLDELAVKCRASLPANAYLLTGGRGLAQKMGTESGAHYEGAMIALQKVSGEKMPAAIPEKTMRGLFTEMAREEFLKKLKPSECSDVNEAVELVSPLPAENLGGVVRMLLRLGAKDDPSAPKICASE